jgi:predicted SprT family Zn-dependent metalloprotease
MIIVLAKKDKEISIEKQIEIISDVKNFLKKDSIVKDICSSFGRGLKDFDGISISFDKKLDVTAKTIDGKIFLNTSLMDEKFEVICRYVVHELTHVFQHMKKEFSRKKEKKKEYLDRPQEIEAFQNQIKFDAKNRTEKEAKEYVNDLLDYHDLDGNKRNETKDKLLKKLK